MAIDIYQEVLMEMHFVLISLVMYLLLDTSGNHTILELFYCWRSYWLTGLLAKSEIWTENFRNHQTYNRQKIILHEVGLKLP